MANITINKSITQPEEVINEFADNLGYQAKVVDPNWSGDPTVDSPEVIDNPKSRTEFVSELFDDTASGWFSQFAERNARKSAEETIKQTVEATKSAVKQTITTS